MKPHILAGWHEAIEMGELRFPRCDQCGSWNWYPLPRCRSCGSDASHWVTVAPVGTLYSWTRVHRGFGTAAVADPPYVTAVVDIRDAPGVRLTCLNRQEQTNPRIGAPVRLDVERTQSGARWLFNMATPS